jgi:hypothetical protein
MEILLIFLCLACVVFRVGTLWQCWTGLLVVFGNRCFYVCGYTADDPLGLSSLLRQAGARLDNNLAEQALKMAILHLKNALFYT